MQIVCKKCGYTWDSHAADAGSKRISCSKCKTSITLSHTIVSTVVNKPRTTVEFVPEKQVITKESAEVIMPVGMAVQLNKFMLARLIGVAKANGEESIKFKVDPNGVLIL